MFPVQKPSATFLAILVVAMIMSVVPLNTVIAQSNDSAANEFVADGTFMVVTVNMESFFDLAGEVDGLDAFKQREKKSTTDFFNIKRYQLVLATSLDDDEENLAEIPYGWINEYAEPVEQEAILEDTKSQYFFADVELEKEEIRDREVYGLKTSDEIVFSSGSPLTFIASDTMVVTGNRAMIGMMLDGEDSSNGRDLVESIDPESQFHLILEDPNALAQAKDFGEFIAMMLSGADFDLLELMESCNRIEAKLDLGSMKDQASVVIEMSSDETAKEVQDLIKLGLTTVPGLMDQADSEMDSMPEEIEEFKDTMVDMIQLGRNAVEKAEVTCEGSTVKVKLNECQGLDDFPKMIVSTIMMQTRQSEEMRERFRDR